MSLGDPDDQFPCMGHHPPGQADEGEPDRLHPFGYPGFPEGQLLHCRVEVEGEDHDPPPRCVFSEVGRGEPPSGEVLLHDGMGFFTLAAALVEPVDELTAVDVPVRDDAEDLVALLSPWSSWEREVRPDPPSREAPG